MNPFKSTSNEGKLSSKKNKPCSSPSESPSSAELASAGTQVHKPFHRMYLEEISRKSRSSTKVHSGDSGASSKSTCNLVAAASGTDQKGSLHPTSSSISENIESRIQKFEAASQEVTSSVSTLASREGTRKVKQIIKLLDKQTEPYTKASDNIKNLEIEKDPEVSQPNTSEEVLCENQSLLNLSLGEGSRIQSRNDKSRAASSKWMPISLADIYNETNLEYDPSSSVVSRETISQEAPLSLSEIYRQANLPYQSTPKCKSTPSPHRLHFSTPNLDKPSSSNSDKFSVLTLSDAYRQANLDFDCPMPPYKSVQLKKSKHFKITPESCTPLSIADIYKQANLLSDEKLSLTSTQPFSTTQKQDKQETDKIPQHLQDMFKKFGAIPKRALGFQIETTLKPRETKSQESNLRENILKLKQVIPSRAAEKCNDEQQTCAKSPRSSILKYYPELPDYHANPIDPSQVQQQVTTQDTDAASANSRSLVDGACSLPPVPESAQISARSKRGDESPSSSKFIPKYTFRSPQSELALILEEYTENQEQDFGCVHQHAAQRSSSSASNNDDGLDIIFGPLEGYDEYDYDEYDYDEYYYDEYDYDDAYIEEEEGQENQETYEDAAFLLGQGGGTDSPDLEFVFDDSDSHGNEIAELYSYTEQPELQLNVKAFEDQMEIYGLPPFWQRLSVEKRRSVVLKLLDQLECSKKPVRMRSARCLLYIAQGCWAEVQSDTEQQHWTRLNALLLFQLGAFSSFTDLLNIEIDNSTAAHVAMRKIAVSLADSQDLRVILSVLYIITEVIRNETMCEDTEYKREIEAFIFEIGHDYGEDHLVIKLLSMVTRFCSGAAPHFPMKKVLLLLWKLTLVSLGGMTILKELKAEKRSRANLPAQDEDTMEIAKTMRSSSPPASASDLLEAQNQKRSTRPFRRSLIKQSSLDDQETLGMEMETSMGNENGDDLADMTEYDERRPTDNSEASQMFNNHILNMYNMQVSPPPQHDVTPRGLPWKPKVRQKDIDAFLDTSRQKFLGYSLPGDQTTLFGLPEPIHEGVRILKEHVYTSLAELQIQKEEEIARNPVSTKEEEIELTPAEILYQAMLPNLPQYMIALLKILLAAAPTSKAKTDSINIMADVLPEEMPMTVLQSMKLGIDVNRHKEIIVKAVSAILLLLLKHFKLNHIYQFEFMSQHLVFANCIPLVLKFFNQNIMAYVGAKNVIPILDFPSCVIGDQPELTAESLEIGDAATFSWRNMFSCINLLRILNKLTKWKHSRIMMLVVFKSAPILKRTLKVRHAMTQLYVLKLLKMQTKYLGRQWRKSNMKTISAIYQKVRHRLNDDWAYGNDLDARPWDFQAEECALRASVDRFNNRRYTQVNDSDFEPVDNNPASVLGQPYDLSEGFKKHYSLWLEQEVHGTPIDWEKLLFEDGMEDHTQKKTDDEQ